MKEKNKKSIEENLRHLKNTADELNEGIQVSKWNKRDLIAMSTYLANMCNGYENILSALLKSAGIEIPEGEQWHKDLFGRAKSENLIPDEMSATLEEILEYRNIQKQGYTNTLEENKIRDSSAKVINSHPIFEKHIQEILKEKTLETNKENITNETSAGKTNEVNTGKAKKPAETEKTEEAEKAEETEFDPPKGRLRHEAVKKRLEAQTLQGVVDRARTPERGTGSNLSNVDLSHPDEEKFDAASIKGKEEVSNLLNDAAEAESNAGKISRAEVITEAKKQMPDKNAFVARPKDGEKCTGKIIARTDDYAVQQITDSRAVIYKIEDISKEANIELGARITLYTKDGRTVEANEKDSEFGREEEQERERGSK